MRTELQFLTLLLLFCVCFALHFFAVFVNDAKFVLIEYKIKAYCSSSGSTTLYIQQMVCVMRLY
jgi:hypothetical protein